MKPPPSVGPEERADPTASSGLSDGAAGAAAASPGRFLLDALALTGSPGRWPSWRSSAAPVLHPSRELPRRRRRGPPRGSLGPRCPRSPPAAGIVSQYSSTAAVPGGASQLWAGRGRRERTSTAEGGKRARRFGPSEFTTHGRPESLTATRGRVGCAPQWRSTSSRAAGLARRGGVWSSRCRGGALLSTRSRRHVRRRAARRVGRWCCGGRWRSDSPPDACRGPDFRGPRARAWRGSRCWSAGPLLAFNWTESDERTSVELARERSHHAGLFVLARVRVRRRTMPAAVAGLAAGAVAIAALAVVSRLWPASFPVEGAIGATTPATGCSTRSTTGTRVGGMGAMAAALALAWGAHARAVAWRMRGARRRSRVRPRGLPDLLALERVRPRTRRGRVVLAAPAPAPRRSLSTLAAAGGVVPGDPRRPCQRGHRAGHRRRRARRGARGAWRSGCAACAAGRLAPGAAGTDRRLRMPRRGARRVRGDAAVAIVVVGVALLPRAVSDAWDDFSNQSVATPADADDPARGSRNLRGGRAEQYESALRAYRVRPAERHGPGTFEFWWNRDAKGGGHLRDVAFAATSRRSPSWVARPAVRARRLRRRVCWARARARARARDVDRGRARSPAPGGVRHLARAGRRRLDVGGDGARRRRLRRRGRGLRGPRRGAHLSLHPAPRVACVVALLAVAVQMSPTIGTSRIRESQASNPPGGSGASAREAATDAVDSGPGRRRRTCSEHWCSRPRGPSRGATISSARSA